MRDPHTEQAGRLMAEFAERTGLTSDRPARRYLWTDAFAVCTLLGLDRATGDGTHRELALRLVDRVHHTLGRHRPDDARHGWISGLGAEAGEAHPTRGGLRIGKPLPERRPDEPADERLEWDRDGQYFHYLTKWMHALDQVARETGQPLFNQWAGELAHTAHRAFTYAGRDGRIRMRWKMSIDLSRPLVASMGQHDPLDGFITCVQLAATAAAMRTSPAPPLTEATAAFASMIEPHALATADPLGLGGLLVDAFRVEQLVQQGATFTPGLLEALLAAAADGLRRYLGQRDLALPARERLAFRELGLAIGLAAVSHMERGGRHAGVAALAPYASVRAEIGSFWQRPEHRRETTWLEHADINDVMLATSLAPDGFLVLRPPVVSRGG